MEKEKFSFTPTGVDNWNTYFYAQDQPYRDATIQAIQTDLRVWIKDTFDLAPDQIIWMDALDDDFIFLISSQLAITLYFLLPVRLIKPDTPTSKTTVFGVKRGEAHNPIWGVAEAEEPSEVRGEFVFTISY